MTRQRRMEHSDCQTEERTASRSRRRTDDERSVSSAKRHRAGSHSDAGAERPLASSRRRRSGRRRSRRSLLSTRLGEVKQVTAERAAERRRSRRRSKQRVVVLFACHGGTGATTIAMNIGAMLARRRRRTCVLDLDLQCGDALKALGMSGSSPLSDVLGDDNVYDGRSVDPDMLLSRLPRHESGLFVLSQDGYVEGLSDITGELVGEAVPHLRRCFDVLLVDGVRDFSDLALLALEAADTVVLIATQDVPSLRGLVQRIDIFKRLGYEPSDLYVLVNRYARRSPISLEAIAEALDVPPSFVVANDFREVHQSLSEGCPLEDAAPRSLTTYHIALVVEELFKVQCTAGSPRMWNRLLGRS